MSSLTYDHVEQAMKDAVPEVEEHYPSLINWHPTPGLHTLLNFVLRPVMSSALDTGKDAALLRRIFDFFEEMARSSDLRVVNLLEVEIFERLVGEPERLATAWKFMGEETKNVARRTARMRHCEGNLPED
jgi:hypothetical protein